MSTHLIRDPAVERARANMIEQQIRTWEVLSRDVLDLLQLVHREDFVPEPYRALAFVDTEIPLVVDGEETGEAMLAPKFEARILQEVAVRANDTVLEIGAGSGYMAALLAFKAERVVTVEIDPRLKGFAETNLARAGVRNVRVDLGNGVNGWPVVGEVDVLVVSGSLPFVPKSLLDQIRIGGRLAVVVGDAPAMSAEIWKRTGEQSWDTVKIFETVVKRLREAPHVSQFTF
jgi:protein-L-isoaspartate(D-aspartate) O-methyltransferase